MKLLAQKDIPMVTLERLFYIIQTLTKSEKRHFRLTAGLQKGTKDYVALFDIMDKSRAFNTDLEHRIALLFNQKLEPARKQLYKVIMKSLRQFESETNVESKLMSLIQDSRILFDKGFINLSLSKLDQIQKAAIKNEKFLLYILAAKQQVHYLERVQFEGVSESLLIEKQDKIRNLLEQELQSFEHASVYEILLLRYWEIGVARSPKEVANLNDLVLEEHRIVTNHRQDTFNSQKFHLNFQSIYFSMAGEPEESIKIYYELENLFHKNVLLWKDNPFYYIFLLDGILSNLRLTGNFNEMEYFLKSLKGIKATSKSLKILIKYKVISHRLNCLVDMKNLDESILLAEYFESSFENEHSAIPVTMRSWSLFIIARAYYASKSYKRALKLLNKVLNNTIGVSKGSHIILCRLMMLQIYTLRGRYDYLEYATRSVERKYKGRQGLHSIEKLIIKVVKAKVAHKPIDNLFQELSDLEKNIFERGITRDLLVQEWMNDLKDK